MVWHGVGSSPWQAGTTPGECRSPLPQARELGDAREMESRRAKRKVPSGPTPHVAAMRRISAIIAHDAAAILPAVPRAQRGETCLSPRPPCRPTLTSRP
jgi:hypothetical protein